MGKCKDCNWWDNPNSLSTHGKCTSRKFQEDIIAPAEYQKHVLFYENFGCIHFERRKE